MDEAVKKSIETMITTNKVVLFMKGNKNFPQCGFSNTVVQVLTRVGVPFETVNVLADPNIRQGIKDYANWPTVPQLYIDGKFVGGADIVRDMYESGELQKLLGTAS